MPLFGLTAPRWGKAAGLGVEPRHAHHGQQPRPVNRPAMLRQALPRVFSPHFVVTLSAGQGAQDV